MSNAEFFPEGISLTINRNIGSDEAETLVKFVLWDDAYAIADAVDLHFATEDVKCHLSERPRDNEFAVGEDGHAYDREKFPPETVRGIAEWVVKYKNNSDTCQEAYWQIVDDAIDEFVAEGGDK